MRPIVLDVTTLLLCGIAVGHRHTVLSFAPSAVRAAPRRSHFPTDLHASKKILTKHNSNAGDGSSENVSTIQILMSDTGGGHRASANALRDALGVLHPGKFHCDIVDVYTEYGPVWPYNDYVRCYKIMAANPWMWDLFYHLGATPLGMWLNDLLLEAICFDAFAQCLARDPLGGTNNNNKKKRADMVVSVHPLTQELPLKILAQLDSGTRDKSKRTTPFATVVTDLGSAHPTWFNPGYVLLVNRDIVSCPIVALLVALAQAAVLSLSHARARGYRNMFLLSFAILHFQLQRRQVLCSVRFSLPVCSGARLAAESACAVRVTDSKRVLGNRVQGKRQVYAAQIVESGTES
jgi:Monogalactosyldiacylglycerol (MGDG) synthase